MKLLAIKALDDWKLEILAVPFGSASELDADGEYFDARTKTHQDKFPEIPLVYYHGYDEDNEQSEKPIYVGKAKYSRTDKDGHWYVGVLDKANEKAKKLWQAAKDNLLKASSGSIAHLVRKIGRFISEWPVAEVSLIDIADNRQPANQRAVALPVMKAVYEQAGLVLPDGLEDEPEASVRDAAAEDEDPPIKQLSNGVLEMSEITPEVQAQLDRLAELEKKEAERAEQAKIDEAVKAAIAKKEAEFKAEKEEAEKKAAEANRLADKNVEQAKFSNLWKYDNVEPGDQALAIGILQASNKPVSEDNLKALAVKMAEGGKEFTEQKMAMKAAGMPMKANELNQSTLASYGDEWVGVAYSNQLWENIRQGVRIASLLPTVTVPEGSESITIPVQSTPPTFYKVAQASAQNTNTLGEVTFTHTSSKMGTANQSLAVGKMGARSIYTGEMQEDGLINWAGELSRAISQEGAEVLDHIILDGDTATTASTNINDIAGTPAGTEAFLLFNGMRKLALVTNTANSVDLGAFEVEDFLSVLKLMGLAGKNAVDKNAVKFVVDLWTHWKALELPEMKTQDAFIRPTIEEGELKSIYGREVIASPHMHRANTDATYGLKANSAGKLDLDTASNNAYGAILAFRPDQWRLGYKRRMQLETRRIPAADATEIVANMRVGLVYRDTDAAAIGYNLSI